MSVVTDKQDVTLTCGFYNGLDRTYDAEQMSSIFDGLVSDGIYASVGECFIVKARTGREISVGTGRAWFNHTWTLNDDPKIITCDIADDLSPRIDTVVIEVDRRDSVKDNFIKVITGEAGTNPVNPELNTETNVYQYPICHIYRPAGVDEIIQANITNCVGIETPFVTGIIETLELKNLLLQWQAELDDFVDSEEARVTKNLNDFENAKEADFDTWYKARKEEMQGAMDDTQTWTIRQEEYFIEWFNAMRGQLSTDAAGNLQLQLNEGDIKRWLAYGLDSGTKTISEDGRTITTVDSNGLTLTKQYNNDFSTYVTTFTSSQGAAIGRMTKRFSPDGSIVSTTLTIYDPEGV